MAGLSPKRFGQKTLMVMAGASLIAGCGTTAAAQPQTTAKSTKPTQLVLYSAQGYDQAEATAFQKATGIKVLLDDMSTGPLLAKVQAEGYHPKWDVIWFDGNGAMSSLDQNHMLLKNNLPPNAANYNQLGTTLLPADHSYLPTGITAAGAIAYNTKYLKPSQVPTTWQGLLSPQFKGQIGMDNPAVSGPTYPLVAGIFKIMGTQQGQAFFSGLKNNGLHIYSTNGDTLQALETGAIKIAMFQDSAEWSAHQKGAPINVAYPTNGVAMLPSDMAIAANAPDMKAAKMFVNFVLSSAGQQVQQTQGGGDSLFVPVIKGEIPNPARPNVPINWIRINPVWAGQHETNWITWFTNNIVQ